MRAGLLALLEHRDRHVTEPRAQLGRILEQLAEADRARETCGACADDQHADVDPLVGRVGRRPDRLVERNRWWEVCGAGHPPRRSRTSSVSFGTTWWTSPTTPKSANSKIGAFGSLLIATIVPELCIPTLCWIAPEIPHAT